jgi:hypothetical protein
MRDIAIAQLGSDTLDQNEFRDLLWFRLGTQIQPLIARYKKQEDFASKMEQSQSLKECLAYDYDYDYDYGYAYAYAYDYDYDYGYGYGYAYAYGYGYGYGYDVWFSKVAAVGVSVLRELNSPGVAWI